MVIAFAGLMRSACSLMLQAERAFAQLPPLHQNIAIAQGMRGDTACLICYTSFTNERWPLYFDFDNASHNPLRYVTPRALS